MRINGKDVSPDLLSPSGWTNTEKRVLFRTYDVTALLNVRASSGRLSTLTVGALPKSVLASPE